MSFPLRAHLLIYKIKPWVAGIRICKDLLVLKIESVYTVLIFLAGSKTVRIGSGFDPVLVGWKENQILTIFPQNTVLWVGHSNIY